MWQKLGKIARRCVQIIAIVWALICIIGSPAWNRPPLIVARISVGARNELTFANDAGWLSFFVWQLAPGARDPYPKYFHLEFKVRSCDIIGPGRGKNWHGFPTTPYIDGRMASVNEATGGLHYFHGFIWAWVSNPPVCGCFIIETVPAYVVGALLLLAAFLPVRIRRFLRARLRRLGTSRLHAKGSQSDSIGTKGEQ